MTSDTQRIQVRIYFEAKTSHCGLGLKISRLHMLSANVAPRRVFFRSTHTFRDDLQLSHFVGQVKVLCSVNSNHNHNPKHIYNPNPNHTLTLILTLTLNYPDHNTTLTPTPTLTQTLTLTITQTLTLILNPNPLK